MQVDIDGVFASRYPTVHPGLQVEACAIVVAQLPMLPFTGGTAIQDFGLQMATVNVPRSQVERGCEGSNSNPLLHTGIQSVPEGKVLLGHCPVVPLSGKDTMQVRGWQLAAKNVPNEQLALPESK